MKKSKRSAIIFVLAALVILVGSSTDVFAKSCQLSSGGGTLGLVSDPKGGDDWQGVMVANLQVVDVPGLPDAHVDITYDDVSSGDPYYNVTPQNPPLPDIKNISDVRVKVVYTVVCENRRGTAHEIFTGIAGDLANNWIWWALGDSCGPFAGFFQKFVETEVSTRLCGTLGCAVLKEQGWDNEAELSGNFDGWLFPSTGLEPASPLNYVVKFVINAQ